MQSRALLLLGLQLAAAAAAPSAERIADARIVSAGFRCLSGGAGTAVVTLPCALPGLGLWELPPAGFPGPLAAGSRCLEPAAAGLALASCSGQPQQDFRRVQDGRILDAAGRCLHAPGGGAVGLRSCDGSPAQRFRVEATNRWTEIHGFPSGAPVESANVLGDEIEVAADGAVFALVAGGPFRSADRGETWARLPGLPIDAEALLADPFDARRLLARQGVGEWYVSRDGGRSWGRLVYPGGARRQLSFDPTTAERWLLSGRQPRMSLLESLDAGRSWEELPGPPVGLAFRKGAALHPTDSGVVAVAVFGIEEKREDEEEGVWISRDRGAHWERRLAGAYDSARFAPDAAGSLYVWGEDGLQRTRNLGLAWTPLAGARGPVVVDPGDPNRLWSTSATSADGGRTWEPFADRQRFTFDIAVDPSDPLVLFTIGETVTRSVDRAATWTRIADGLPRAVTRIAAGGDGEAIWILSDGPWRSRNGGVTWESLGPEDHALPFTMLALPPSSSNTVYLGDHFFDPALYVSHDGGTTWRELSPGQPVEQLAISRASPARLIGYDDRLVSRSLDGGETWTPIDLPFDIEDAEWDPHAADVAYLATSDSSSPEPGVFRSTDAGATFARVLDQRFLLGVAVDPGRPGRLLAFDHRHLWRSDDRGATWLAPAPLPATLGVETMVASAATDDALFLASRSAVHRSLDAGDSWATLLELPGSSNRARRAILGFAAEEDDTLWVASAAHHFLRGRFDEGAPLLLGEDLRFAVEVSWRDFEGRTGAGRAVDRTGETGYFWFLRPENVELMVKVLDGRPVNGRYWVFYGALSNVEYEITVTDRFTGRRNTYRNPLGRFGSLGDIEAFPASGATTPPPAAAARAAAPSEAGAVPAAQILRLRDGRFAVEVSWRDFAGRTGFGTAAPITDDTGAFWFLDRGNEELVVKVLDGRPLNGRFWVFYGALSNVEYEITVTDGETGTIRRYANPLGRFGSFGDIGAF